MSTVLFSSAPRKDDMDAGEDQNTSTPSGNPQSNGNSRTPQIAHMSLYERQAVQVCYSSHTHFQFQMYLVLIVQYAINQIPDPPKAAQILMLYQMSNLYNISGCTYMHSAYV